MDMLAAGPPSLGLGGHGGHGGPCQRRDVREWQHMDPLTGDRLRARLEADRWIVGQAGRYDKVVDSRDVTAADGRLHSQHKQLEVLQARTAKGSVQVVRSRTVSSARWSSDNTAQQPDTDYDNLQLTVHPLDLSTQRERAGIGRSGSIATRRPPSRPQRDQISAISSSQQRSPTSQQALFQIDRSSSYKEEDTSIINDTSTAEQQELYRSNSTEDLSSLEKFNDEYEQVGEWRRVSKIRRSLQFPGRSAVVTYKPPPSDLPDISGCVSKIRRELESCAVTSTPKMFIKPKRHAFITMDSLQEVRGRLRKSHSEEDADTIAEKCDEQDENDDGIVVRTDDSETDVKTGRVRSYVYGMESASSSGTGSLESRRARDTEDWHTRRKSYGFEGVLGAAPVSAAMVRSDTSTDSGICRSTELTNSALYEGRGTVVTLGKGYESNTIRSNGITTIPVTNGITSQHNNDRSYGRQQSDEKEDAIINKRDSGDIVDNEEDTSGVGRRSKKVEFCKTEVHFAADSGRVNIVETDGKPPPTQNFRRRRRVTTIGTISAEAKANLPVVHFGDNEQNMLSSENTGDPENDFRNAHKVKPVRPRSFHMGDVAPASNGDGLWGVRLRHVAQAEPTTPKIESPTSPVPTYDKDSETTVEESTWSSVAERIRAVEDRKNRGFSTKVNFGSGEPIVESRASIKGRISQDWNPKSSIDPVKPRNGITSISINNGENISESIKKISTTHINTLANNESLHQQDKLKPPELCQMPSIIARKDSLRRSLARDESGTKAMRAKSPRPKSPRPKSPRTRSPLLEVTRSKFKREKSPIKDIRKSRSPVKTTPTTPSPAVPLTRGTRQLREHELSYFGVKVNKNKNAESGHASNEKPDLLRHSIRTTQHRSKTNDRAEYVNMPRSPEKRDKNIVVKSASKSPDKDSKTKVTPSSPIYQNLHGMKNTTVKTIQDFDALSLEDLTKAADEILQAVSDYAEEENNSPMSPAAANESKVSPPITETPKRRDKRTVEEKGIQVSRGLRESQRRLHKSSSSKGTSLVTASKTTRAGVTATDADSTERMRSRRRSKDSCSAQVEQVASAVVSSSQQTPNEVQSQEGHHMRTRRHHMQRASSREALLELSRASSDEEQPINDVTVTRRHRRRERSIDRSAPVPEYHHKIVTSTIRSVAEKAAAKPSKKHSERHIRMERKDYGNDSF